LVLTAFGTINGAVEAMKLGAADYLQKPIHSPAELRIVAERALERGGLKTLNEVRRRDQSAAAMPLTYGAVVMKPVVAAIEKVARTSATVLLTGESGVGKEVAARTVHHLSPRADGPFIAINCGALPGPLLESALFGHEKGAFTGATKRKRGLLELADGGTVFLDEIGELAPHLQVKLLRVIQDRRFKRVGSCVEMHVDVRWIAATNRDLEIEMAAGRFRRDLYHRLGVFPVHVPPLRRRPEDIVPLAERLLINISAETGRPGLRLTERAEAKLARAQWPGNVRQLSNALERAAILADGSELDAHHLDTTDGGRAKATPRPLLDLERDAIENTLEYCGGHRKEAAGLLGIGLRTLYEKLKRYGLS
jgi:two-component system response regulator FlrC